MKDTVKQLQEANKAYREGNPIMTDQEFDELESKLYEIDPDNDWFKKGINDEAPKNRKVELSFAMASLNKVKTVEELLNWADKFASDIVITPKFDGLSVGLIKKGWGIGLKNKGLQAFTRGDGQIGQDCSMHLATIGSCLNTKVLKKGDTVRGEIIFLNSNFVRFKELHPEAKNSRNSATGLINGDYDAEKLQDYRLLSVMSYSMPGSGKSKTEQLQYLNSTCNPANDCRVPYLTCTRLELRAYADKQDELRELLFNLFRDWKQLYPIDGLVFDVDDPEYRTKYGTNGNPEYAIAYKDPDFTEKGVTTINRIELQLNRDGIATPVVYLDETLNLSGADVSKVNGINMRYIHDWGLFDGPKVTVVRSGEVIPKIVAVDGIEVPFRDSFSSDSEYKNAYEIALRKRWAQPSHEAFVDLVKVADWLCPYCHEMLVWDDNRVQMVCPNLDCSERKIQSIVQFVKLIGIKNFGEESIRQLYEYDKIKDIKSLFYLEESDFVDIPNWGEKSITAFLSEIKRIANKAVPFAQIAHAFGYFGGLGQKTIQMIVDAIGLEEETGYIKNTSIEELCKIEGVQQITAEQFKKGLQQYESELSIWLMLIKPSYVVSPKPLKGKLSGLKICFTGFRDAQLKGQIEELGGQVVGSVSKSTFCLVAKDIESNGSKINKAKELNILIFTPEQFRKKFL